MIDFSTTAITVSASPYDKRGTPSKNPEDSSSSNVTSDNTDKKSGKDKTSVTTGSTDLTTAEIHEVAKLKARDLEVKAHEQAHISAGGAYVRSGAHYEYQKGPDGANYAVGGEVQIDTSPIPGDPEATTRKMQVIRSAALAPATPSAQDRNVASEATQIELEMRMEIVAKRYEEASSFETGKPSPQRLIGAASGEEAPGESPSGSPIHVIA